MKILSASLVYYSIDLPHPINHDQELGLLWGFWKVKHTSGTQILLPAKHTAPAFSKVHRRNAAMIQGPAWGHQSQKSSLPREESSFVDR